MLLGYYELDWGPLEEQKVLRIAKQAHQSLEFKIKKSNLLFNNNSFSRFYKLALNLGITHALSHYEPHIWSRGKAC